MRYNFARLYAFALAVLGAAGSFAAPAQAAAADRVIGNVESGKMNIDVVLAPRNPVFGREGNSVSIVRGGKTLATSDMHDYRAQPAVYQKFVNLPQMHGGSAIATRFIVDGRPSAIALRVGGPITDARARFVPMGLARS